MPRVTETAVAASTGRSSWTAGWRCRTGRRPRDSAVVSLDDLTPAEVQELLARRVQPALNEAWRLVTEEGLDVDDIEFELRRPEPDDE